MRHEWMTRAYRLKRRLLVHEISLMFENPRSASASLMSYAAYHEDKYDGLCRDGEEAMHRMLRHLRVLRDNHKMMHRKREESGFPHRNSILENLLHEDDCVLYNKNLKLYANIGNNVSGSQTRCAGWDYR